MPASIQAVTPLRCASSSHSAQSSALRAPPGGSSERNCSRVSASLDALAMRLQGRQHVLGTITEVVDASRFAAARVIALPERHDGHRRLFEYVAGYPERSRKPQRFVVQLHFDARWIAHGFPEKVGWTVASAEATEQLAEHQ